VPELELLGSGFGDLRLDLDRHTGIAGLGAVEHFVHTVDHRLHQPLLDLRLFEDISTQSGVSSLISVTPSHPSLTPSEIGASGSESDRDRRPGYLGPRVAERDEEEVQAGGQRLGEISGRIVGELFFGLVEGDPNSLLSKERDWKPKLPSRVKDNFTMGDLLRLVGEINPLRSS
jgi:hypothetical protein